MSTWVLLLRTQEFQPTTPLTTSTVSLPPSTLTWGQGARHVAHLHWGWVCILACVMVPSHVLTLRSCLAPLTTVLPLATIQSLEGWCGILSRDQGCRGTQLLLLRELQV